MKRNCSLRKRRSRNTTSPNVTWQGCGVPPADRNRLMGHPSCVLWFTGLSGAGKSTLAGMAEHRLHARGVHTFMLDGDNIRHGLNRDLGFSVEDRAENVRRVGEVAKLMMDAGLAVTEKSITTLKFMSRRLALARPCPAA